MPASTTALVNSARSDRKPCLPGGRRQNHTQRGQDQHPAILRPPISSRRRKCSNHAGTEISDSNSNLSVQASWQMRRFAYRRLTKPGSGVSSCPRGRRTANSNLSVQPSWQMRRFAYRRLAKPDSELSSCSRERSTLYRHREHLQGLGVNLSRLVKMCKKRIKRPISYGYHVI